MFLNSHEKMHIKENLEFKKKTQRRLKAYKKIVINLINFQQPKL